MRLSGPVQRLQSVSIPKWYDLKAKGLRRHSPRNCFNSKMVRFKAQFTFTGTHRESSFNSKMVRFKEPILSMLHPPLQVSIPKWYDLKPLQKRLFWLNFKVFCGIFQLKNRRWPMTRFY